MNEKGQFLLYDALISILILFIVITAMFYILNQEEDFIYDNTEVIDRLNILSSYYKGDKNVLFSLEDDDEQSIEIIKDILSDKDYILQDLTINRTILSNHKNKYRNSVSSKKIIEEHEFRLIFYY